MLAEVCMCVSFRIGSNFDCIMQEGFNWTSLQGAIKHISWQSCLLPSLTLPLETSLRKAKGKCLHSEANWEAGM